MNNSHSNKFLKFIFILSILGMVFSSYLVYLHYSELSSPCDFSKNFSCSLVNRSRYAEIVSIPVSILGLVGYSILGLLSVGLYKKDYWRKKKIFNKIVSAKVLLVLSGMALLFSLYLTYAEFFLIKSVCIVCVLSQITIVGIAILNYFYYWRNLNDKKDI